MSEHTLNAKKATLSRRSFLKSTAVAGGGGGEGIGGGVRGYGEEAERGAQPVRLRHAGDHALEAVELGECCRERGGGGSVGGERSGRREQPGARGGAECP